MKKRIIAILKILRLYKSFVVPKEISKNFIELTPDKFSELKEIIHQYCPLENYLSAESRNEDIDALFMQRLNSFRNAHTPFLEDKIGLKNKTILEIGCGSGSSTVALAEQGAIVTGIDINNEALKIAQKRRDIYGLKYQLQNLNAVNIQSAFCDTKWDIVIFYASLEHMLPTERIKALKDAYALLKPNGHLCVFGTPNRLWPIDLHTSELPFFMWLQDEIALNYAVYSPRTEFSKIANQANNAYENLYRWGRGVSYHEFEVALKDVSSLSIVGSLPIFLRPRTVLQKFSYNRSVDCRYKKILSGFGPKNLHPGFYESYLDLIIKKT